MSTGQFGGPTPLDELCDAAHEKEELVDMIEALQYCLVRNEQGRCRGCGGTPNLHQPTCRVSPLVAKASRLLERVR